MEDAPQLAAGLFTMVTDRVTFDLGSVGTQGVFRSHKDYPEGRENRSDLPYFLVLKQFVTVFREHVDRLVAVFKA
jgi:hypothetical protein